MTGRWRAVVALAAHTIRRTLGVGADAWTRTVVAGLVALAYLPAVVAVGAPVLLREYVATADTPIALDRIRALALDDSFVPKQWQYFEIIAAVVIVFTAFVGPSATTDDRTDGMISVYARSPLGAGGYVLAAWLAATSVLLIVTAGPLLLLLVGEVVTGGAAPAGEQAALAGRILLAGTIVAGVHAAVSVGVGLLSRTRAEAVVAVTLVLVGASALAPVLTDGGSGLAVLVDVHGVVLDAGASIVGRAAPADAPSGPAVLVALALWSAAWLAAGSIRARAVGSGP